MTCSCNPMPASYHAWLYQEAKDAYFAALVSGQNHVTNAHMQDYFKCRQDFVLAEWGEKAALVEAILEADEEKTCLFKLFFGGEQ